MEKLRIESVEKVNVEWVIFNFGQTGIDESKNAQRQNVPEHF